MSNLLVDERDQKFVLHEMLKIGELCQTPLYEHLTDDVIDASLDAALKLAVKESYPVMAEADREGCRVENGNVCVPRCYHRLKELYTQGKFASAYLPREIGGLGFPISLWSAFLEDFSHNLGLLWLWSSPFSPTNAIAQVGTEDQKKKYLPNLVSGKWGSAVAATEEQAGSDVALQTTLAVRQPDGSYRIKGTKPAVTGGDSDLFENMVLCVLARVEGDPANATGLSLFLVPKFLVNEEGSIGPRNDYTVTGVERKLGLKGSPTTSINFGENGNCYAELLGERRQAMSMMLALLQKMAFYGAISTGIASTAYLHSLEHAKNRVQGVHISEAQDPDAKRVAIIAHPYIRHLLLWMKSHVEGMRALVHYNSLCLDKANSASDPAEREKWSGLMDMLLPLSRIYMADRGFKVTEAAIRVHGRYGYFSDYPVDKFLRDILPLSWWELGAGVHTLLFICQTLFQRDGKDFANLVKEMQRAISECDRVEAVKDLARDVQVRVNLLAEMGQHLGACFKEGKAILPICNGTPFVTFMGDICMGWMHLWQAGIAIKRLDEIYKKNGIDPQDAAKRLEFLDNNKEAAFYDGKAHSARFFIKNVLPQVDGMATAIRNDDLSTMAIHNSGF